MAVPGNIGDIRWGKQSGGGSVVADGAYSFGARTFGPQPQAIRTDEPFEETTGARMKSDRYVSEVHVGGDIGMYVTPLNIGSLVYGVLGAVAETGVSDPYSHTMTPATSRPWWTFIRMAGGLIWERFQDVKIDKLVLHGETGKPLTATATLLGLKPQSRTSNETVPVLETTDRFRHYDGAAALRFEGNAIASIDNWDLTIDNHGTAIGGDSLTPIDISEGELTVTVAIRKLFLTASLRNRYLYGGATPTLNTDAVSAIMELVGSPAGISFLFTRSATRTMEILVPRLAVEPFDIQPSTSQDPLREQLTLEALQPSDASAPITIICKNNRTTVA